MISDEILQDCKLDFDFLNSIYEGDSEHALMIFEQFLNTQEELLADLDSGFKTGDVDVFRQKIHKTKPVFSFVGATSLTKKAELIEKKCLESTDIETVSLLYTNFLKEYGIFLPLIKEEHIRLSTL